MDNIENLEMIQYYLSGTALLISICAAVFFGVWAITAGREGNTKLSRIFSALGCLSALWLDMFIAVSLCLTLCVVQDELYSEIEMPDGSEVSVLTSRIEKMKEIASSTDDSRIDELDKLLEKNPELVYWTEPSGSLMGYNVLDMGAACGNYEAVETALKHNAPIDRYKTDDDTVYPETTTLSTYLDAMKHRSVTEDDLKIMQLLLDSSADTRVVHDEFDPYSVILGKAAWSVLYNDDEVTDVEVELIQLMKDNGCIEDSKMADEHCSFWTYPGYREGVYCGLNYYKVLGLLGSFG